jgi:uncharacterized membrane protein YhaH (DUF805 family)
MSAFRPSDLWSWRGTVGRGKYAAAGLVLFALKHNLDRLIAFSYNRRWSLINYWLFEVPGGVEGVAQSNPRLYASMVAAALPFVWVGVVMTIRRLRDAGLPPWLVVFFFAPFLNLFFFLLLAVVPSRAVAAGGRGPGGFGARLNSALGRIIPDHPLGSAALSLLVAVPLAVAATLYSVRALEGYGWGLFVGLPFFLGLLSVLLYGFHRPRTLASCVAVSLLSVALVAAALVAFAVEGLICVVMAAPLAAVLALAGGLVGFVLQRRDIDAERDVILNLRVCALAALALPGLMSAEHWLKLESPLYEVKTSVAVNAPPGVVWRNLVEFAELPPANDALFRAGVAYPVSARVVGRGAGAVRYCVFSTGAFVEPIEVWDEPRLLRFAVTAQPPSMTELSPYEDLRPPHLENYLSSRRGQFRLTPLAGGRTLLEGTTWYENRFWPGAYWRLWSDAIIHRIHRRVLDHIRNLSEHQG